MWLHPRLPVSESLGCGSEPAFLSSCLNFVHYCFTGMAVSCPYTSVLLNLSVSGLKLSAVFGPCITLSLKPLLFRLLAVCAFLIFLLLFFSQSILLGLSFSDLQTLEGPGLGDEISDFLCLCSTSIMSHGFDTNYKLRTLTVLFSSLSLPTELQSRAFSSSEASHGSHPPLSLPRGRHSLTRSG